MGKHKNSTQNCVIMEFMEKYPDLARGFTKRDKPTVDSLWQKLAESLNGAAPPQKNIIGWKKTWTECKSDVKRKLAQNKAESRATGGGPCLKHQLTNSEERIIRVCGIGQSVGVSGVSLGLPENEGGESAEEMPSTSSKRPQSPLLISSTTKRIKINNTGERLNKFLDEDKKRKVELNEKLYEHLKIQKENASNLRRVYRPIDKGHESITNAVAELKNEFVRVSRGLLQSMQEKTELKKKQLDLDIMKFEYQKNNE